MLSFSFLLPAVRAGRISKETHFKLVFFLTFSSSFYFYSWNNFQAFFSPPYYPCPGFSSFSHIKAERFGIFLTNRRTEKINLSIFIPLQDLISSLLCSSGSFQRGLPVCTFTGLKKKIVLTSNIYLLMCIIISLKYLCSLCGATFFLPSTFIGSYLYPNFIN